MKKAMLLLTLFLLVPTGFAECPQSNIHIFQGKQVIELTNGDVCKQDIYISAWGTSLFEDGAQVVFDCNGAELNGTLHLYFPGGYNVKVVVENCNFKGKPTRTGTGLKVDFPALDRNVEIIVENNTFSNLRRGIDAVSGWMLVKNNLFKNNKYAIGKVVGKFGVQITENRFENNQFSFQRITSAGYGPYSVPSGGEIAGNKFEGGWLLQSTETLGAYYNPSEISVVQTVTEFEELKRKLDYPNYPFTNPPICMTSNEYSHMNGFIKEAPSMSNPGVGIGEYDFGCPLYHKRQTGHDCRCPGNLPEKAEPLSTSAQSEAHKNYIKDCNGGIYTGEPYLNVYSSVYDRIIIQNCKITGPPFSIFGHNIEILNNEFYGNLIGIHFLSANFIRIINNKFENKLYGIDALYIPSGGNLEISNNEFLGNKVGINSVFTNSDYRGKIVISNNKFEDTEKGINKLGVGFNPPYYTSSVRTFILNNTFFDKRENISPWKRATGIDTINTSAFVIKGNEFKNLSQPIRLLYGAYDLKIAIYSENRFDDVGSVGYTAGSYGHFGGLSNCSYEDPWQTYPKKGTEIWGRFGGVYDPRSGCYPWDGLPVCFSDNNIYRNGQQIFKTGTAIFYNPELSVGWFPFGCFPVWETVLQDCPCESNKKEENHPPKAEFTAIPREGFIPLTVDFDASKSSDPDGDNLAYHWSFSDRNSTKSIPKFALEFNSIKPINVTLEVKDSNGLSDSVTKQVYPYTHASIIEVKAEDILEGKKASVKVNCTQPFDVNLSLFKKNTGNDFAVIQRNIPYPCNSGFAKLGPELKEGLYLVNAKTKIQNCVKCLESTYFIVRRKPPHTSTPETHPALVMLIGIIILIAARKKVD